MASIAVNLDPCINAAFGGAPPLGTKIRIKIGGVTYNYWATKTTATSWTGTTTALHGATLVEIGGCLPAQNEFNPATDWLTIYGIDYYYDTTDSKFKCGRPN